MYYGKWPHAYPYSMAMQNKMDSCELRMVYVKTICSVLQIPMKETQHEGKEW